MKKLKKVAMIGTAPSAVRAPYDDKSWELWCVGGRNDMTHRVERWFEVHDLSVRTQEFQDYTRKCFKEWQKEGTKIYMHYPEFNLGKGIVAYPIEEMMEKYGSYFMTSSFSWMMALAIEERYDEIALFGVDMEIEEEYKEQRVGFQHFMHLAKVLGIKVHRLPDSGIAFDPVPYPMWTRDPLLMKLRLRLGIAENNTNCQKQSIHETEQMISATKSMLDEVKRSEAKGYDPEARRESLLKVLRALEKTLCESIEKKISLEGQLMEQNWLMGYIKP